MARPIYSYELDDPDFSWLITKYRESHPNCQTVETLSLPVIIICGAEEFVPSDELLPTIRHEKDVDDCCGK